MKIKPSQKVGPQLLPNLAWWLGAAGEVPNSRRSGSVLKFKLKDKTYGTDRMVYMCK